MAVKVTIIDVNIGDIDQVIEDSVAEITGKSKQILELAIEEKKQLKQLQERKQQTISKQEADLNDVYEQLLEIGEKGVPKKVLEDLVIPQISPTMSGFTLKMKKLLRSKGNEYIIKKERNRYFLEAFNPPDNQNG